MFEARTVSLPTPGTALLRACVGVCLALVAVPSFAATHKVHPDSALAFGPPYYATVQEANAVAVDGDSVIVSSAGSPYVFPAPLELVNGVFYRGAFSDDFMPSNTMVDETILELQLAADSTGSVVDAGNGAFGVTFAAFTVTGGNSGAQGGGLFIGPGTTIEVRNCLFRDNYANVVGGGVHVGNDAIAEIANCEFVRNVAGDRGGGINIGLRSDQTTIDFCTFEACSAGVDSGNDDGGGAISCGSSVFVRSCTFRNNWSGTDGGAVLSRLDASMRFASNWFFDHRAERDGGTIFADGGGGDLGDVQVERSVAGRSGGAAYFRGGTWQVRRSFFRENSAEGTGLEEGGGAFYFDQPTGAAVRSCEVVGNSAQEGGGFRIVGANFRSILSVEVRQNTLFRNSATGVDAGGGIHIGPTGNFADRIENNIISDTLAGSGISCFGVLNQPAIRHNCIFTRDGQNLAPEYGGDCDDRNGINGNIRFDPRFCDPDITPPNLRIQSISNCVGAGSNGEDLGVHPGTDCVAVSVEPMSWGKLKAAFR